MTGLSLTSNGNITRISYIEKSRLITKEFKDFDEAVKVYDSLIEESRKSR